MQTKYLHIKFSAFLHSQPHIMKRWKLQLTQRLSKNSKVISFNFKYTMIHVRTSYLKQIQETFLTTSNQTIKFRRAKCFPPPPFFLPFSLFSVPHTRHSCDHDPNHYWHTAPSPLCGFLCPLARSATGPPPHFDLDLGGNVIQRGAEAQRHYCSSAVGPPLHICLSSLAGPHAPARRLLL